MKIQRAITLANLAFIALGAYFAAGLFYQIWGLSLKSSQPPPTEQTGRMGAIAAQKPYRSYQTITQRDLFKTRKSPATPARDPGVNLEELGETSLKLKLWGTVTGDPQKSYAVIENTQNRQQNLYRVGDSVQNATLKMIFRSKVVLTYNGRDEMLAMEKIQQGSRTPTRRASGRTALPSPAGGVRTQRVSLRRNMINDAMQDVSKLMTEIKISPRLGEDGQASGLAVSNIKPNSIFRRMGLRNGDVLKSVDGQDIRSVDDALKLYESMKSADKIAVQIERRGRDRNIEYNIRQ